MSVTSSTPKRILFYAYVNHHEKIARYVEFQLKSLRSLYDRIIFVSSETISETDLEKMSSLCDVLAVNNAKSNFQSLRDVILNKGWDELGKYDWFTIMDNSSFGPVFSLPEVYQEVENSAADFWNILTDPAKSDGLPDVDSATLASEDGFFTSFSNSAIQSSAFQNFWEGTTVPEDAKNSSSFYHSALATTLGNAGFIEKEYTSISQRPTRIMGNRVEKMPFIKINYFLENESASYLVYNYIKDKTDYDIDYVKGYFTKVAPPSSRFLIHDKLLKFDQTSETVNLSDLGTVALHIHTFYPEILKEIYEYIEQWKFKVDLFITTDSAEKEVKIRDFTKGKDSINIVELLVLPNLGRDVIPWLKISDKMKAYDVCGHIHTKRTKFPLIGESWRNELYECILGQANQIMKSFAQDDNLGVVIPDFPNFFNTIGGVNITDERLFVGMIEQLFAKLPLSLNEPFYTPPYIFPVGNMFWYRTKALSGLLDIKLDDSKIPREPLEDITILHAFERSICLSAIANDFSYSIAPLKVRIPTFTDYIARGKREELIYAQTHNNFANLAITQKRMIAQKVKGKVSRVLRNFKQGGNVESK